MRVCLLVTFMSPAETAKSIKIPFGRLIRMGPMNHVLDNVHIPKDKGQFLGLSAFVCMILFFLLILF